nr:MAG TPA: hypothetical protein [Caudoviricetes sp.]
MAESSRPRPADSFNILVKDTRRESGHQAMDEKFLYLGQPTAKARQETVGISPVGVESQQSRLVDEWCYQKSGAY